MTRPENLSDLSISEINTILKNTVKTDFKYVSIQNLSSKNISVGFLSYQDRWSIKYRTKDGENEMSIFIKRLPPPGTQRELIEFIDTFRIEAHCYETILKDFQKIIKHIPFPEYYYSRSNELIVLEDLISKGFRTQNLLRAWDLNHCQITLEALAKYHAASFILEFQKNSKINKMYSKLFNDEKIYEPDNDQSPGTSWLYVGVETIENILEEYLKGKYTPEIIKKGHILLKSLPSRYGPSSEYPNVLVHFDLWGNNIMYRYDESDRAVEARLVDFQLTRYMTPGHDIYFFLHTCTTASFRNKYESQLIKYYYNYLCKELSLHGFNIDNILSWKCFEDMLNNALLTVLAMTPIYVHYVCLPLSLVKELIVHDDEYKKLLNTERFSIVNNVMKENNGYKNKILESITQFYDYISKDC